MSDNNITTILAVFGLLIGAGLVYAYYRPELMNYQNEISALENEINGLDNEIQTLNDQLNLKNQDIKNLEEAIDDLEVTNEDYQETNESTMAQFSNLKNQYTDLENEFSTLKSQHQNLLSQYNTLLDNYQALLFSYPYPVYQPVHPNVNFLTMNEIDPDNSITVISDRVTWDHLDRNLGHSLQMDLSPNSQSFVHQFDFRFSSIEAGDFDERVIVNLWTIKNSQVSLKLDVAQFGSIDNSFRVVFYQQTEGNNVFVFKSNIGHEMFTNRMYSVRIIGQGNRYRVQIWEDNVLELDTEDNYGISTVYDSISIIQSPGVSDDKLDWSSGYIENLQIFNYY